MIKISTRGQLGLYKNGKTKACYNHFDSYPEGLGVDILKELKESNIKELNEAFDNIELVDEHKSKPTKQQIKQLKKYSDLNVSSQKEDDWYCLLRNIQGTLKPYLAKEVKYMLDSRDFIKDSLFCEWAYIVNLDSNELEVWRGFQEKPNKNRYSLTKKEIEQEKKENKHRDYIYYACDLLVKFPLSKLPSQKKFLAIVETERLEKEGEPSG